MFEKEINNMSETKTNAMRILDKNKIKYNSYTYECESAISGAEVAKLLNFDEAKVFKTLVCTSKSNGWPHSMREPV